ncbi:MAG: hypothetical protein AAGF36_01085 [Pseudomonadota bacterium]
MKDALSVEGGHVSSHSQLATILLAFTIGCISFVLFDALWLAQGASLTREGGGIEIYTVVLYAIAMHVFFTVTPREHWARLYQVPTILMLFAARELDFDKAFTLHGILSTKFYVSEASLTSRIIGGLVVLGILWVAGRLVMRGIKQLRAGVREGKRWPWMVLAAFFITVFVKSIDGLARKLEPYGVTLYDSAIQSGLFIEEGGESLLPLLAILAIIDRWSGARA